jgi:hypothetical protein
MRRLAAGFLFTILAAFPSQAAAQQANGSAPRQPTQTHIYFGLWSVHLNADRIGVDSNNVMLGVTHGPVFATTFVNSFGKRAYAAGLQRALAWRRSSLGAASLGVRLGAISGYDERFLAFAKDTPVIPMASVYTLFELKRVGIEASWTLVVASAAISVRF